VEYFKYVGSMITNDARYTCDTNASIAMANAAFSNKNIIFKSKLDLN
jgi:hypothetical protein